MREKAAQYYREIDSDVIRVQYHCGHEITIPGAAFTRGSRGPVTCPTCMQAQLNQRWVDQEEAKLWNTDPNWGGFPPMTPGAVIPVNPGQQVQWLGPSPYGSHANQFSASAANSSTYLPETGPLAWLDYQLGAVIGRAR